MPGTLEVGTRIPTMLGKEVRVLRYLGGGGQGDVYEVLYGAGEHKALKWYRERRFYDERAFVRNLKNNIGHTPPHESFLWPIDMTDYCRGTFGYVMDLRRDGYEDVDDILLNNRPFPSLRRCIDACMGIISAFCVLHQAGYSYQDVNLGNFFINPQTGKVLVCDNDNIAPDDTNLGIVGTMGFIAPEVILGGMPNAASDRYSLAILVFLLLFRTHPLEGLRVKNIVFDSKANRRVYGTHALFVLDEHDTSNALDPENPDHRRALMAWDSMPEHFRQFMRRAFSQESIHRPASRLREIEWLRELVKLRTSIIECPRCGSEVCFEGGPTACDFCGTQLAPELVIDLSESIGTRVGEEYLIPVVPDARIYQIQVAVCDYARALDPVACVVRSRAEQGVLGLMNMSKESWECRDARGSFEVAPRQVCRLSDGLSIRMGRSDVSVHALVTEEG